MKSASKVLFTRNRLLAMTALASIGIAVSGYLAWQAQFASGIAGCGGNQPFDCEHVLNSSWSKVFGLSVSTLAVALYATLLTLLAATFITNHDTIRRLAANLVFSLAITAGLAGIWFVVLQAFVLHHFCPYCLAAHVCGLSLAALVLFPSPHLESSRKLGLLGLSLACVTCLATAQILSPPAQKFSIETITGDCATDPLLISPLDDVLDLPLQELDSAIPTAEQKAGQGRTEQPLPANSGKTIGINSSKSIMPLVIYALQPASLLTGVQIPRLANQGAVGGQETTIKPAAKKPLGRTISINNGAIQLNSWQWPIIGKPNAKFILVEMFDYTCPHCRETNKTLKEVANQYGDDLAILMMPVPMNSRCNDTVHSDHATSADACELAKIAIAVWLSSPEKFGEFHQWMMADAKAPDAKSARAQAIKLVGATKLDRELNAGRPEKCLKAINKAYKRVGAGQIPKIVFPRTIVVGKIGSAVTLRDLITQNFSLGSSE